MANFTKHYDSCTGEQCLEHLPKRKPGNIVFPQHYLDALQLQAENEALFQRNKDLVLEKLALIDENKRLTDALDKIREINLQTLKEIFGG